METRRYRIGLLGFGRTGKSVATVLARADNIDLRWVCRRSDSHHGSYIKDLLDLNCERSARINSLARRDLESLLKEEPIDILVDFSSKSSLREYHDLVIKEKITLISAISAYDEDDIDILKDISNFTKVLYSPNITVGVNFLLIASKILRNIAPRADVEIIEEHFSAKPETSGTAKIIAEKLDINPDNIKSIRAGGIIGVHEVIFGFPNQTVRLIHESISREAFGNGVIFILKNLPDQDTGFFNMESLLKSYFSMEDDPVDKSNGKAKPWWKFWLSEIPANRYIS